MTVLDVQGELGDWIRITDKTDRQVFETVMRGVGEDNHGRILVDWSTGEPIDAEGFHYFFGCLWSGLEVLEDVRKEFGEERLSQGQLEALALWDELSAVEARYPKA